MPNFKIPAFGERICSENQANATAHVWSIEQASQLFEAYGALLSEQGYEQREGRTCGENRYAAWQKGSEGVFINAYGATDELRIVSESACRYFDFSDRAGKEIFAPQITQVKLNDYGMSYVIRLADGRFILIDGGFIYDSDADALQETLQAQANGGRPVIAAWILTHQHEDHFHCFLRFMEKYGEGVEIEKFLFNFPDPFDFDHYPEQERDNAKLPNSRACVKVPELLAWIKKLKAPIFTPHTGQKYRIGDAEIELLSCIDDTIHQTQNGNATSLVFRMELGSQVILWTADAGCSYAKLAERYGAYLKADILQIPHHGFQSGKAEAEIRTYQLCDPKVCLLPVDGYCAYTFFCLRREGTRYLMQSDRVEELIDGDEQRTLVLPYTPRAGMLAERKRRMQLGMANNGARCFVFSGLCTANEKDLCFTLLNMTVLPVSVRVELYFEDKKLAMRSLWAELLGSSLKICRLTDAENGILPADKRLPEYAPFAVRFLCDVPIVVTNEAHAAAYYTADGALC